jgi:membrane protease YdiL (CAAX protease family)
MQRLWHFETADALLIFVILGAGFSLAAFLLTIGSAPLEYHVTHPAAELAFLCLYLLPLMALFTWGGGTIHRFVPAGPAYASAVLVAKLVCFVALPAYGMHVFFGYRLRELVPVALSRRSRLAFLGLSILLLGFQSVFGRGLSNLLRNRLPASTLAIGFPVAFVWLALEAGVVEEFFFRVLLQSRLAAALRSELSAIVLMSLLFGLAHAPGLYLRTSLTQEGLPAHPPLLMAIGYSIVITSVAGFFFGVLWARTLNFVLIVLVHAMVDLLPDVLPTLQSLHLLR